jgi:NDP-sugar pyrophosphorylase family protein
MKAIILCAGLGTRLGDLTRDRPKVMMPVGGKPLLQHHIELLRAQGVTDIGINLHYLPETITDYFGDGKKFGVRIRYSLEKEILGTAGGVKQFASFLGGEPFWVFYGDNLFVLKLETVVNFHREKKSLATIVLFEHHEPWTMGVVETDANGRVLRFVEKGPRESCPPKARVNGGIYLLEPRALDYIPKDKPSDFGRDVFPEMLRRGEPLYAMFPGIYLEDIGTPERYAKVQRDFAEGKVKATGS